MKPVEWDTKAPDQEPDLCDTILFNKEHPLVSHGKPGRRDLMNQMDSEAPELGYDENDPKSPEASNRNATTTDQGPNQWDKTDCGALEPPPDTKDLAAPVKKHVEWDTEAPDQEPHMSNVVTFDQEHPRVDHGNLGRGDLTNQRDAETPDQGQDGKDMLVLEAPDQTDPQPDGIDLGKHTNGNYAYDYQPEDDENSRNATQDTQVRRYDRNLHETSLDSCENLYTMRTPILSSDVNPFHYDADKGITNPFHL